MRRAALSSWVSPLRRLPQLVPPTPQAQSHTNYYTSRYNNNNINSTGSKNNRIVHLASGQSRPWINGKPVAFHVNDLKHSPLLHSVESQQEPFQHHPQPRFGTSISSSSRSRTEWSNDDDTLLDPPNQRANNNNSHTTNRRRRRRRTHPTQSSSVAATTLELPHDSLSSSPDSYYDSDLIVVLDMDECLIHCQYLNSSTEASLYSHQLMMRNRHHQKIKQQTNAPSFSSDDDDDDDYTPDNKNHDFRVVLPDAHGTGVHVHVRPGLIDFLSAVTRRYETHIYTAALPIIANPILNALSIKVLQHQQAQNNGAASNQQAHQEPVFAGRWYREHCTYDPAAKAYVKDLFKLSRLMLLQENKEMEEQNDRHLEYYNDSRNSNNRDGGSTTTTAAAEATTTAALLLKRTVLVDNNPLSFLKNPENGILVNSYYTDATDTTLRAVRTILDELDAVPDVRPILTRQWHLLEQQQEGSSSSSLSFASSILYKTDCQSSESLSSSSVLLSTSDNKDDLDDDNNDDDDKNNTNDENLVSALSGLRSFLQTPPTAKAAAA